MESIPKFIEPDMLGDNCHIQTKETIRYDFSEEEMNDLKDEFFQVNLFKSKREHIIKSFKTFVESGLSEEKLIEAVDQMNFAQIGEVSMKILNKQFSSLLVKINNGYDLLETDLYGFAFQELERMAFYTPDGHFYRDRPLKPTERQASILSIPKTA